MPSFFELFNPFCNFPELLLQSQIVEFVKIFTPILVQFKGAKKHQKNFFKIILKFQKHTKKLLKKSSYAFFDQKNWEI
jgi:hypothetical protein